MVVRQGQGRQDKGLNPQGRAGPLPAPLVSIAAAIASISPAVSSRAAAAMKPIAESHGVSQAAVAIAWTLAWPGVTGAIVGARRPEQIDDWLAAATLELNDADLDEIAETIRRLEVGSGPRRAAR